MHAKETAIVLIEFQNDFCSPDGALHEGVKGELSRQRTVENTVDLVEKAREKGMQIMHATIHFTEDYHELEHPTGILKGGVEAGAFRQGTKGVEIVRELTPH